MVRRTGKAKTITVFVPRHGTPAASRALMKAVAAEANKTGHVFQEQDQISDTELQGLVRIIDFAFYVTNQYSARFRKTPQPGTAYF
jgi:hypothetical protein